jgi:Phosphotransferase enzyme family
MNPNEGPAELRLEGGNVDGAVRAGDTVRRSAGPWTAAVHALLAHLADKGFTGAPRPLGFDEQGREILTFLAGETIGIRKPRPAWVHAEATLVQVARWMRTYHQAVADFIPPPGAIWRGGPGAWPGDPSAWRGGGTWSPGLIIAHNDAATYNAAWHQGKLTGFFDWDFAGPAPPEWDLALAAFSWVPLHTRAFITAEGFTDFTARPRRLDHFLRAYGWSATTGEFLEVVESRVQAHADGIRDLAAAGDEAFGRLLRHGVPDLLDQAVAELANFPR